jgi:IS30 family transposase
MKKIAGLEGKGTDFGKVTQDEIDKALGVINYTVRRKLNIDHQQKCWMN